MKFSDYAKSIGKTRGYIHKLYAQGRLDKAIYTDNGRKRINKEIADAILKGLSNKNLYTKQETNFDTRYTNKNQLTIDSEFESITYDQARRMKVYYEAQLEKFHLEKEKGKYLLAEDVKKEAYRTGLIFRDKVLALPAQIVSELIDITSEFEMQNYLQECLSNAIEEALNSKNQDTNDEESTIYEDELKPEEAV